MKKIRNSILALLVALLGACADDATTPQETLTAQATWPTVQRGAQGQTVETIQYLLRHQGQSLSVNGLYGSGTAQAVRNFQSASSLAVDGVVGPNTWRSLVGGDSGGGAPGEVCYPSGLCLSVAAGQPDGSNQTYWDPNDSGNPLLAVSSALGENISANFTVRELVSSGSTTFSYARIDPELVRLVQGLRDAFGQPLVINSGYRSHAYNESLSGSATYSQHRSGRAVDIRGSGLSGLDLAKKAIDTYGCNIGVGVGTGYAHIDVRGSYASWEYDPGLESQIDSYYNAVCN